ncbi:MAG TPA: hypothetical protein PKZ35_09335 [Gammaproteobacteria bacterium]|nr:hypothetical protein [Gammaproteobacteria bacterium]
MIEDKSPKGFGPVLICVLDQLKLWDTIDGRDTGIVEQCRQFGLCQDASSAPFRRDNAYVTDRSLRESP